jgi:hypothetical protein
METSPYGDAAIGLPKKDLCKHLARNVREI